MKNKDTRSPDHIWFALADAQKCRLLRCHLTKQDTPHVDECDALDNELPEHEHGRPMALGGMTGHSFAAPHHDEEEAERRFAAQIVEWLQDRFAHYGIERLTVLAPPRLLGVLRKTPLGSLKGRIEEREGNLMRLQTDALSEHPLIHRLLTPKKQA
ncbi:MAG TPA: host attachment protein [Phycisphaerae bacterium]|nr:host attachment protein [Phycisphaerae bacterium]